MGGVVALVNGVLEVISADLPSGEKEVNHKGRFTLGPVKKNEGLKSVVNEGTENG